MIVGAIGLEVLRNWTLDNDLSQLFPMEIKKIILVFSVNFFFKNREVFFEFSFSLLFFLNLLTSRIEDRSHFFSNEV